MSKRLKTSLIAASLLSAAAANAAIVIDQSDNTNNAFMAAFSQTDLAQSFIQSATNITGAGIFLRSGVGSSDNVTISLWTALPNVAGATQLATGSVVGTQGSWADVSWAPVTLTAATQYFLVFSGNRTLGIAGDVSNTYAFGNVFANGGYGSFGGYDYTFRTYSDNALGAVPEPASWALMVAGFGLAGIAMRRRRQTVVAA